MNRRSITIGAALAGAAAPWCALASCGSPPRPAGVEIARVTPSDAGAPADVRSIPSRAASAWCDELARTNAKAVEATFVPDAGCFAPELACVVDPAGAGWGFEVSHVGSDAKYDSCTTTVAVDVVRRDDRGLARAAPDAGLGLVLGESGSPGFRWNIENALVKPLGDWDGDGRAEVLVTRDFWAHEGERGDDSRVWTYRRGALVPYAPAEGLTIVDTLDADGDGKVDLVTRGPYASIRGSSALGYTYANGPAIFLAHVGHGGTLSQNDAVAMAFTASKCSAATEQNETLACARLRGASAADVIADLKKSGCVDFRGDPTRQGSCDRWIPELLAVTPPFRLP